MDIGCYSYTIDHVGEQFKVPTSDEFGKFCGQFVCPLPLCPTALAGKGWPVSTVRQGGGLCEVLKQIMLLFENVLPFLQENVSPATCGKLIEILTHPYKKAFLMVELAVVIDIGEHFVKVTYSLEGGGPLVFSCLKFCL